MIDFEKYKILVPLVYLVITSAIAIVSHMVGLPKEVTGMLIGAGLTRVKMPSQ